jgi:MFS family permease
MVLSAWMGRVGRRPGLVVGYLIAAVGAVLATAAAKTESFALLIVAVALFGTANTAGLLSRYAAGDAHEPERRGRAISLVVWAGTLGAVVGPNLLEASGRWVEPFGLPKLAGPFVFATVLVLVAAGVVAVFLRPDPLTIARSVVARAAVDPDTAPARPVPVLLRRAPVQVAIAAMTVSHLIMVTVMVMTPVHMRTHDHGLGAIGGVISAHIVGMFAFSPLTGWVTDRIGRLPVILAGGVTLVVACLLARTADPDSQLALTVALVLLGVGWNLGFIAGSSLLSDSIRPVERPRMQGFADLLMGVASATASLTAGLILGAWSYDALGGIGAVLAALLVVLTLMRLPRLRPARAV